MTERMKISATSRRDFLKLAGIFSVSASTILASASQAASLPKIKSSARIVIVGGGAAGLTAASRLVQMLDGASITIVDGRKQHFYQPGYSLIAAGIKPASYSVSSTSEYIPQRVNWITEPAAELDPEGKKVVTQSGKVLPYDYLILCPGLELNYSAIEGMDISRIGQNGLGSLYYSADAAFATWQAMSRFTEKGGIGVFGRPQGEMKCAGAPLKYTFVTDDYLRRRNTRSKSEVHYMAQNDVLFSVPIVSEKVRMLFEDRGIKAHYKHVLNAIDIDKRIARYQTAAGLIEQNYDFINVIPPMRAPLVVRNSSLPWQQGPWASDGYAEVDQGTLRHKRFPNVFAVGDVAGVPKGKTAASVKWQVPVALDHLVADISGKKSDALYEGYTSCPLITRLGRAMLIEFDYKNNLVESFPGVIAPLEELWVSWVMKTMALKPTYISMLRGKA